MDNESLQTLKSLMSEVLDEKLPNYENDLNQYYRIAKLENEILSLLNQIIQNLTKRVEELERKTA